MHQVGERCGRETTTSRDGDRCTFQTHSRVFGARAQALPLEVLLGHPGLTTLETMRHLPSLLTLVLLCSCPGPVDPGTDAGSSTGGGGGGTDAGLDAGTDAGTDAGVDAGVDAGSDAGVDAGPPPLDAGYSQVQCRSAPDCPGQSTCTVTAPGGVCNGCGSINDCPSGTDCGTFGACTRDCTVDADCGGALRCTGNGLCAIRSCSASNPCPAPYLCGTSNLCQRPTCGSGCPAPFTCVGTVCVEP